MDKKEVLKKLTNDFYIHTLCQSLDIDHNDLIERNSFDNDKIIEKGIELLLNNKSFKTKILDWIFPFDCNGIMLSQEYFLSKPDKAYEQIMALTETEEEINKIFSKSSQVLSNEVEDYLKYRTKFVDFLSLVILKSKSQKQVEKMFMDFTRIKKSDKTDLFPIISSFLDRGIAADKLYESIQELNNRYLETRLLNYVQRNNLFYTFELENVEMYETEEKIIFEKSIKFNTNYFMGLGLKEEKVLLSLEKFSDLICKIDNMNYLLKKKDKTFTIVMRSEKEETINKLYSEIKENSSLILEFVQGYDDSQEYLSKFMVYWHLNNQFKPKEKNSKLKI